MRFFLACFLLFSIGLAAEPVSVRYSEGTVHGFLSLRSAEGQILATGDLTQMVHGDHVVSHLVFRFKDGSIDDEMAEFSQNGVFRLLTDHHIQKGPAFSLPTDLSIDVSSGKVTVRSWEKGKEKLEIDRLDLPPDLANGVLINMLKNISPGIKETTLSYLALTPKPRLIKLLVTPSGESKFSIAGVSHSATRFDLKPEIGGIVGFIAPLIGKQPPDNYIWISSGDAPAFVKSVGAQSVGGPIWTIELASPLWP